jgi:hypothetical protein
MPTIEKIFPENIRLDGGTQPRAKIDQAICDEYEERMKAGEKFPPIDVFFDGENYWLADGFHRIRAYMMAVPGEAIECNVFQGTQQDAQWHSYSVNRTHGLRRTNADKLRALKAALNHSEAADKSNVEIAEHCGVDEKTVRRHRSKLTSTSTKSKLHDDLTSAKPKSRPRRGRDGRVINTANIGSESKKRTSGTPSRHMAGRVQKLIRTPTPMQKMTAINMPHDPIMGARTLIEVFATDYLRALLGEISNHLKGLCE